MPILKETLPICKICNKPVEKITRFDRMDTMDILYKVYCHGEVEEVVITNETIVDALSISFGYAFKQKRSIIYNKRN